MHIRKLLLTTTSLCVLAFTPLSALAQDAGLVASYEAYVAASSGDDADAKAAAEAAFLAECARVGTPEKEACIALATSAAAAPVEQPAPDAEPAPAETPAETPAPAAEQPAPAEQPVVEPAPDEQPAAEQPATEQPATEQPATEQPASDPASDAGLIAAYEAYVSASSGADANAKASAEAAFLVECNRLGIATLDECLAVMGGAPAVAPTGDQPSEPATNDAVQPVEQAPKTDNPEAPMAPATDSAKDEQAAGTAVEATTEPAAPAPASDAEAQSEAAPAAEEVAATMEAKGEPVTELTFDAVANSTPAPQTNNNSFVINIGVNINLFTPYKDRDRIGHGDDEVYYERLENGRVRQTVIRDDGTRIVTVWNRYGEIIRRVKERPDGTRIVLIFYSGEDRGGEWRDPGDDLPPFHLTIPVSEYVFYAEREDEDQLESFLLQPPLERAARVYSVDEVKQSARLRDTIRRVEIGDLTFDTGKATVDRDQVGSLTKVAAAMKKILDNNPSEIFLIEGHTDAVGSDESNLVLSDARAEAVAQLLSEFYDIPPENLTTQGYGERYLKVETEDAERANRRVTIRRITTLVAPSA